MCYYTTILLTVDSIYSRVLLSRHEVRYFANVNSAIYDDSAISYNRSLSLYLLIIVKIVDVVIISASI